VAVSLLGEQTLLSRSVVFGCQVLTKKLEPASAPAPKCAASPSRGRLAGPANSFTRPRAFEACLADQARACLDLGVLLDFGDFVRVLHVQATIARCLSASNRAPMDRLASCRARGVLCLDALNLLLHAPMAHLHLLKTSSGNGRRPRSVQHGFASHLVIHPAS
jgi:hypothetical protein